MGQVRIYSCAMVMPVNCDEDPVFTDAEEQNRRVNGSPGSATRRISVQERVRGLERPLASPSMSQKRRRVAMDVSHLRDWATLRWRRLRC